MVNSCKKEKIQSSNASSTQNELYKYLKTNFIDFLTKEELEKILAWWKIYERTFLVLSIKTRDLLTPPMSTIASEYAFSAGNQVLDKRRTRLALDILNCLMCMKDWEDERLVAYYWKDNLVDYFSNSGSNIDLEGNI